MSGPALVVGLGNPGPEYERTRHNAGFLVVDVLANRFDVHMRAVRGIRALAGDARAGDRKLILAKPTTFMNLSGEAVRELSRYYKVPLEDVIIVHDEIDLPLGTLRVKRGGGDAGHNGLRHITRALGSPEYARVRVGVGRPAGRKAAADHVLDAFSKGEAEAAEILFEHAADAALAILRDGVDAVQNALHGDTSAPKKRRLKKTVEVPAAPDDVFDAWTTDDGVRSFFAPGSRVELREEGPYELYFNPRQPPGDRGSDGCSIISFERPRALAFTWNQPPSIPTLRDEHTRVDVALRSAGKDRTRVTLTHTGWGDGPEWDRAFAYFNEAWDVVLDRLRSRFEVGPIDWGAHG